MNEYKKLCQELIEEEVAYRLDYEDDMTRQDVLEAVLENTENIFGNIDGSRTCSTYEAQKFINESNAIFDEDIHELFKQIDENYFQDCLSRGAETLDVVILELLAPQVIEEMMKS